MPITTSQINGTNPNHTSDICGANSIEGQLLANIENIILLENNQGAVGRSSTSEEIIYIPILFKVLYNQNQNGSTSVNPDTIDQVFANIENLIASANNIFAGTSNNSSSNQVEGNWNSILDNAAHQVTSNIRFFLPWKIPKEYLFPFFPSNIVGPTDIDVNLNSIEDFKNSFGFGLSGIPSFDGRISYTSSNTYTDVKAQRVLVRQMYADSLVDSLVPSRESATVLLEEMEKLRKMEDDYFLFFGDKPGLIFVRRFDDDSGFYDPDGITSPFQMNAIRALEHGNSPMHHTVHDNTPCGELYANASSISSMRMPSRGLFSNIPFFQVSSTTKQAPSGYLGSAIISSSLKHNVFATGGINLTSVYAMGSSNAMSEYTNKIYSTFLHEFFHTLGYGHARNGISCSGTVTFESSRQFIPWTRSSSSSRINAANFDKMYLPFEPPFTYYDPNNDNHILEDILTLPNFEVINPDEKKYVETMINHIVPTSTQNFSTGTTFDLTPSHSYGGMLYEVSHGNCIDDWTLYDCMNGLRRGYSELFGAITHLPTFWGGSYTTNTDGSKSMLINPTSEVSSSVSIGDFAHGGIVFQINEDGTGLVAEVGDYPVGEASESITIATAEDILETYTSAEGYSDWYVPSLQEGQLMVNTIGPGGALGDIGNFTGTSTYWRLASNRYGTNAIRLYNHAGGYGGMAEHGSQKIRFIRAVADIHDVAPATGRIGPDITVYNPVCLDDGNGGRTLVNWALPFTLDWYNDSFPAFPDNTRVEDMFSPELCPCLYTNQTLTLGDDGINSTSTSSYTFKLFNALVDNNTGAEIVNTTGVPVVTEGSKKVTALINSYNNASQNSSILNLFGGNQTIGNVATNWEEYFGSDDKDITWLKEVGGMILPNFPVYVGFMPESPLPSAFRYDMSKFSPGQLLETNFYFDQMDHNDPSTYSSWGQQFYTFIDKYLRPGSTDPDADDYNPFLVDITSAGIESDIGILGQEGSGGIAVEYWKNYQFILLATSSNLDGNHPLQGFFLRQSPNTANPALDDIPDTLYGPMNQNTLTNTMYYQTSFTEPALPTPDMMRRLNYLGDSNQIDSGILYLAAQIAEDLYDVDNTYSNIIVNGVRLFPDYKQRTVTSDQINLYVNEAINFIENNAVEEDSIVYGCMDVNAMNYNPNATFPEDVCIDKIFGCTNSQAVNYNENANTDDGSCEFYSLEITLPTLIPVCPAEIVSACNYDQSGYTPLDLNYTVQSSQYLSNGGFLNVGEIGQINNMLNDSTHHAWSSVTSIANLNNYRYGLGINKCTNELGTVSEGALNVGGGCINVVDLNQCIYPTVTNYQCDMLGDVVNMDIHPHVAYSNPGNVVFSEAGTIQLVELTAFFSEMSSLGYTIGQCNSTKNSD